MPPLQMAELVRLDSLCDGHHLVLAQIQTCEFYHILARWPLSADDFLTFRGVEFRVLSHSVSSTFEMLDVAPMLQLGNHGKTQRTSVHPPFGAE